MSGQPPTSSQGKGHAAPPALQTISNSSSNRTSSHRESLNLNRAPPSPQMSANRSSNLTENFRSAPLSPRAHRTPSMSQQAIQDLLNNPPSAKASNPEFDGRDWRAVKVGEIVDESQVRFAETSTSVEDATNLLISSGPPNVVLLRDSPKSHTAIGTFDYSDLNAYLLLVVGIALPDETQEATFRELVQKGREGKPIPMKDVKNLGRKEPLVFLPHTAPLTKAVEIFGSGIHRTVIVKENTTQVIGVLTQLRLVQFFWENGRHFSAIEPLYHKTLRELDIGSHQVFAINGDKPLTAALEIMNIEGITSLPVLDSQRNVVGNISHVDVRLLTKNTSTPLLRSSCLHFISVILSERGVDDGKDSYPVFYVNPVSTLAHTVAKLVATRSHRMWVVESPSPASSGPPTPLLTPAITSAPFNQLSFPGPAAASTSASASSSHTIGSNSSVSASTIPGASLSGRLTGVISLTDILNQFGLASGLHPQDPSELRKQRRRSSSSSLRRSVESSRSESVGAGSSVGDNLSRRESVSGRR